MRVMQYAGAEVAGGLLSHLAILVEGLAGAGHSVHVLLSPAPGADETAARCRRAGARVSRLTVKGKTDVSGMMKLRGIVARESPDIFHLHLSSPVEALPALLAARWGGAAATITTEHAPTWSPLERIYSRSAKKAASRSLDAVIALCEADARFLEERFRLSPDRITVIPNGVPEQATGRHREEARSLMGLSRDTCPLVGYLGALETKKGVLDLLEGAALAGLPHLAVALAGSGSLEEGLRGRAEGLPYKMVLAGRVERAAEFLRSLDLFVLPSHQEAMPLALLEAMRAGLPIIAARVGGIPEAIQDGRSGLLVDPHRPDQIAAAIRRLAQDEDLARRLGRAARREADSRFTASLMVMRVEGLYARIAGGAGVAMSGARA